MQHVGVAQRQWWITGDETVGVARLRHAQTNEYSRREPVATL